MQDNEQQRYLLEKIFNSRDDTDGNDVYTQCLSATFYQEMFDVNDVLGLGAATK